MSTQKNQDPIEILLVSDTNYASYLATTLVSILKNAASDDILRFHIVDGGMTQDDINKIEQLKSVRDFEAIYYRPNIDEYLKYFRKDIDRFPVVVNYRLFLAKYLPETLDKIIYLDVAVIVLKSLRDLWETPLDGAFVAAIPDENIDMRHVKRLPLPDDYQYFNSGILLFNLKKWRDENILEQLLDVCVEIRDLIKLPDQDVLNVYASRTRYQKLPRRWNCHPRSYDEDDTVILHYMGVRYRLPRLDILFSYAAQTPYGKLPIQKKTYKFKRWLSRKKCQIVCLFLFKRKWRQKYRERHVF